MYARWSQNIYRICFNANNGTGEMEEQCIEKNTQAKISVNQFIRDGYKFVGWNTEIDGSGQAYMDEEEIKPTENITLYAQWEEEIAIDMNVNTKYLSLGTNINIKAESVEGIKEVILKIKDKNTNIVLYNNKDIKQVEKTISLKEIKDKIKPLTFNNQYELELEVVSNTNKTVNKTVPIIDNTVSDVNDLKIFRNIVNSGNTMKENIIYQLCDIDLEGSTSNQWIPIGNFEADTNTTRYFEGTYDGGSNGINNIYIDKQDKHQGFFGINKGTIRNVGTKTGTIRVSNDSGAVVGLNYGLVTRCYNNVDVYANGSTVGGVVGRDQSGGRISECYNSGNLSGELMVDYTEVCGVCGYAELGSFIEKCYNTGNISAYGVGQNTRVGGISTGEARVESCYNTGNLTIESERGWPVSAGIWCQSSNACKIYNCYNTGKTTINTTKTAQLRNAGIIGYRVASTVIENCYWLSTASPEAIANSSSVSDKEVIEVESEDDMKKIASMLGDDYTEDKNVINNGFPILKWQEK